MTRKNCVPLILITLLVGLTACSQQEPVVHQEPAGQQAAHVGPQENLGLQRPRHQKGQLTFAVSLNDVTQVVKLLREGADVNENVGAGDDAVTPLLVSILKSDFEMVSLLLMNGAAQHPTYQGYTALDFAIHDNQADLADLLLSHSQR